MKIKHLMQPDFVLTTPFIVGSKKKNCSANASETQDDFRFSSDMISNGSLIFYALLLQ